MKLSDLIAGAADRHGVPLEILQKVAQAESSLNPSAVSPKGAMGVMQLMPGTARDLGVNPQDPAQNIDGGARYLRQMFDKFGDWGTAVQAYNAGPAAVQSGRAARFPETQAYTRKVMGGSMPQSGADIFGLGPAAAMGGKRPASGADIFSDTPTGSAGPPRIAPQRVDPNDLKNLAYPGYTAARGQLAQDQARAARAGVNTDNLANQVARNSGLSDELAGGMMYLAQGGENLVRRVAGKPVGIPASTMARAAMDDERAAQARFAQQHPTQNAVATGLGIAAAGRPSGLLGSTNPLVVGAQAAAANAPFALGRQRGGLLERLPGAAAETAISFGAGAGLQAAGNALGRAAAGARARPPSPARQLAAEGVDLTPGQIVGGLGQRVEDAMTSTPILGDAIRSAKVRGMESFNRAALNRVLDPIGETLPANVNVGRDGLTAATDRVSQAYQRALGGVTVTPDAQFAADIGTIVNNPRLPPQVAQDVHAIVQNTIAPRAAGPMDGVTWKAADSELGAMARAADNASAQNPVSRYLRDAIRGLQQAHMELLDRTDPAVAASVRAADEATANLVRVRQASQYVGTSARNGVFSPADLNRAVQGTDTSAGNRAFAGGHALMQDLTDPAMRVLPQTVPDSGTPLRSLISVAGLSGGGMTLGANPMAVGAGVGGLVGASGLYSRPVIALVNAAYRASTPGAARAALAQLAVVAAKNPELTPLYEAVARKVGVPLPPNARPPMLQSNQPSPMMPQAPTSGVRGAGSPPRRP